MAFLDREFIACLKCTQDCFNWHAGHVARPIIAPSFVSRVHHLHDALRIPRQFSGSFLGKCSREVTLEGPSGRKWHVELKKDNDRMVFSDPGWSDFVKYYGLQIGNGLLFTFLGRGIFKVRIFDTKGYEKGIHCQLSIPTVDTCASKVYHINQGQYPPQNSSNHLVDPNLYDGPPHKALTLHHSQNFDNTLPEKASVDNTHHQYNEVMEFDACEEEILTIANHHHSALIEENTAHHEDRGQHKPSIERNFKHKVLDASHSPALNSFDAGHYHRDGMSDAQEVCDQMQVCNEESLEINIEINNNDDPTVNKLDGTDVHETSIKSATSCDDRAFNAANCVDGGNEARSCAICEGETRMSSNVHDNEELYIHIEQEPSHCCGNAIAIDGHFDKGDLMNSNVHDNNEELMNSNLNEDEEKILNTENGPCQCCDSGLALDGLGQQMAQKESYEDLMQEGRCTMAETGRKLSTTDITKQQAATSDSVCGCNFHKSDALQTSTRSRTLTARTNLPEAEKRRLICDANAFRSQFPIARKSLKPSYNHKMVFPKIFVEKFMPKKDVNLTLRDPYGKDWPCKWLGHFRGSNHFVPCISAGWSQFAHVHRLKTHDILVFELIDTTSLHFKVHFFQPKANSDVLSQPPYLLSSPSKILQSKNHFKSWE